MPEGDLIDRDYQIEAQGLLLGDNTPYRVSSLGRLKARKIRTEDVNRAGLPGVLPGRDVLDADTKVFKVNAGQGNGVTTGAQAMALADALETAWLPGDTKALVYQLPGHGKRRRYGRFRDIEIDIDRLVLGHIEALCPFEATDPREYDNNLSSGSTGLPVVSGGLTFNATPNFSFGALGAGGSIFAANAGDTNAPWIATITGPVTDPQIESVTTGQILRMVGSLAAGDTLTVDSDKHTVFLNSIVSRFDWVQAGSLWPDLLPGSNQIRFGAASGSGTLMLAWRSTWS